MNNNEFSNSLQEVLKLAKKQVTLVTKLHLTSLLTNIAKCVVQQLTSKQSHEFVRQPIVYQNMKSEVKTIE